MSAIIGQSQRAQALTEKVRAFNVWRDDFLLEASTTLLIVGFIMGTVDIFTSGSVASATWFKIAWAIVQALAIDGLFFAVWGRVARATWTRRNLHRNISLVLVGLILALVAAMVNDILTFQQLNGIANSIDAIQRLGIDVQSFTHVRAILVVGVGVLVQVFCRSGHEAVHPVQQANGDAVEELRAEMQGQIERLSEQITAKSETPEQGVSPEETAEETMNSADIHLVPSVSNDDPEMASTSETQNETTKASPTAQERAARILRRSPNITAADLATKLQITPQYAGKLIRKQANG